MKHPVYFIPTILICTFLSCKNYYKSHIVAGEDHKFWDVIEHPAYCYEFFTGGACRYYVYKKNNGRLQRELFDFGDVIYPNEWSFTNDRIIKIQGFDYYYTFINNNLLKLTSTVRVDDTLSLKPAAMQ